MELYLQLQGISHYLMLAFVLRPVCTNFTFVRDSSSLTVRATSKAECDLLG